MATRQTHRNNNRNGPTLLFELVHVAFCKTNKTKKQKTNQKLRLTRHFDMKSGCGSGDVMMEYYSKNNHVEEQILTEQKL